MSSLRIVQSIHLVVFVENLDAEQLGDKDACGSAEPDQKSVLSVEFHGFSYFLSSGDKISVMRMARQVFASSETPNRVAQNQNGLVPALSRVT